MCIIGKEEEEKYCSTDIKRKDYFFRPF